MGSSAALVTSLVGALLYQFNIIHLSNKDRNSNIEYKNDLKILHNLSQLIHSIAQGIY